MQPFLPLDALGRRIVILGPSNAGKSTLAVAIGHKTGLPAIHLDRLRHLPNTDWVPRSDADFHALHDEAILGEEWVMDGNYSVLFPQRFARATGMIVLRDNHWSRTYRYFRRTLFEPKRAGHLDGARDSIKWEMIHWVFVATARHPRRYLEIAQQTGLPLVDCGSMRDLRALYRAWELER